MEQHRDEHLTCADCSAPFLFSASEAGVFAERGLAAPKRCKDCRRARKERTQNQGGGFAGGGGGGFSRPRPAPGGPRDFRGPPPARDGGFAPSYGNNAGGRSPRYTGDVNEYRSPMQDNSHGATPAPWGSDGGYAPRAPRRPAPPGGPRPAPRFQQGGAPQWPQGEYRHTAPRHDGGFDRGAPAPGNFDRGAPGGFDRGAPGNFDRGAPGNFDRGAPGGFDRGPERSFDRGPERGGFDQGGPNAAPRRRPQAEMFSITCNSCGVHAEVPFRPAEGRDVFCQACYRARKPI